MTIWRKGRITMNMFFFLIPLTIGAVGVLQGTVNRAIGQSIGLAPALTLNSILVLGIALGFHGIVRWRPEWFPELFHDRFAFDQLAPWMILPAIFGFCIIGGLPWAISKLGAARVFLAVIVAQVIVSIAWDALVEKKPVSMMRIGGALLTVAGVALVSLEQTKN